MKQYFNLYRAQFLWYQVQIWNITWLDMALIFLAILESKLYNLFYIV